MESLPSCGKLQNQFLDYLYEHVNALADVDLGALDFSLVQQILQSDELRVTNESRVLQLISLWLRRNEQSLQPPVTVIQHQVSPSASATNVTTTFSSLTASPLSASPLFAHCLALLQNVRVQFIVPRNLDRFLAPWTVQALAATNYAPTNSACSVVTLSTLISVVHAPSTSGPLVLTTQMAPSPLVLPVIASGTTPLTLTQQHSTNSTALTAITSIPGLSSAPLCHPLLASILMYSYEGRQLILTQLSQPMMPKRRPYLGALDMLQVKLQFNLKYNLFSILHIRLHWSFEAQVFNLWCHFIVESFFPCTGCLWPHFGRPSARCHHNHNGMG